MNKFNSYCQLSFILCFNTLLKDNIYCIAVYLTHVTKFRKATEKLLTGPLIDASIKWMLSFTWFTKQLFD